MVYILVHREVSRVIILYDNVFNKHDLLCRTQGRCTWENPCLKARILNWKVRDGHKFVVKLRKKFYGWKKCHKNSLFLVVSFACPEEVSVTIHWLLKYYPCHNEFNNLEVSWKTSFYLLAVFFLSPSFAEFYLIHEFRRKCTTRRLWATGRAWTRIPSGRESTSNTDTALWSARMDRAHSKCLKWVCYITPPSSDSPQREILPRQHF